MRSLALALLGALAAPAQQAPSWDAKKAIVADYKRELLKDKMLGVSAAEESDFSFIALRHFASSLVEREDKTRSVDCVQRLGRARVEDKAINIDELIVKAARAA